MNTFLKSIAIVTGLGLGTAAVAQSNFGFQTVVDSNSSVTLDLIRTVTAGTVAVYDYSGGEFGELLGTADLNAGVNTDVSVTLDNNTASELAAVIYEGEMTDPAMASNWIELTVEDDA